MVERINFRIFLFSLHSIYFESFPYAIFSYVYITLSKFEKTCAPTFPLNTDEPPADEVKLRGGIHKCTWEGWVA